MLLNHVNSDPRFAGKLDQPASEAAVPVLATPAAAVATPAVAAKVAGAVVGGGAVTGAAYAAYRAVAN